MYSEKQSQCQNNGRPLDMRHLWLSNNSMMNNQKCKSVIHCLYWTLDIYCILHCINANKTKNCPPNQWFIYYDLMGKSIWWSCDRKLHWTNTNGMICFGSVCFGSVQLRFVDEWIWFTFTAKLQCIVICGFSLMKWHYKIYRNHSIAPLNLQYFRDYGLQKPATDLMERF